jgi:flagellar secretion chaperone FliS
MIDPLAAYRSVQVISSNPVSQIALLYEGAIRFATKHLIALEKHDIEGAHQASLRSQEIVGALQEMLDLSQGDIARNLDSIYTFILGRLIAGNISKSPKPTEDAIALLRELHEAWQAIAGQQGSARDARPVGPVQAPVASTYGRVSVPQPALAAASGGAFR